MASIEISCGFDFARKSCQSRALKKSVAKRKDFTHGSTGALACASRQTPPGGGGATWFAACLRGRHCRDDSAARLSGLLLVNRSFDFREKLRRQLLHSMRRTCVISALRQYFLLSLAMTFKIAIYTSVPAFYNLGHTRYSFGLPEVKCGRRLNSNR